MTDDKVGAFTYTIVDAQDGNKKGICVNLTQLSTGVTKPFYQAGVTFGNHDGIERHMRSLTKSQCDAFFEKKGGESNKKKK